MLLLGIDLGTSSIKVSVIDADTQQCLHATQYPEKERGIISINPGWAEQDPNLWWEDISHAIKQCHASGKYDPADIGSIGIAYQMHGLVLVDREHCVLRNAIIWCDSRAVAIGERAFSEMGEEACLSTLLNSPGNFTASKLAWVKDEEPETYARIDKVLLPGDFIALRLTGEATTTASALSEGILWDFVEDRLSTRVIEYFGFDANFFPAIHPVFGPHGYLRKDVAGELHLRSGIPVSYKAGDQPNNALALHVTQPGEVATTAGTSGVIYGVSDELHYDRQSRINSFAHVNHDKSAGQTRIGILLCINGVGIFNRWVRDLAGNGADYQSLNLAASAIPVGSEGLIALPFGNGAERMLGNAQVGAHLLNLDLNIHQRAHLVRAAQEGIAFSFRYGLDIMRQNGIAPRVVRAGRSNLFLSQVFSQAFADINKVAIEFYEGDGSFGAAIGAGIGIGYYASTSEAAGHRQPIGTIVPTQGQAYEDAYGHWLQELEKRLKNK